MRKALSGEARLDADFAGAHVAAAQAELAHAGEGELAQVALLDAAGDEGHGDVALDAVYPHPRRHQRQQPRHLPRPQSALSVSLSVMSLNAPEGSALQSILLLRAGPMMAWCKQMA